MKGLKEILEQSLHTIVQDLYGCEVDVYVTSPDPEFGDFATNIAMQIAKKVGMNPREVASAISVSMTKIGYRAEPAGPGFINIFVSDSELLGAVAERELVLYKGESIVVEYSCPNYFKELHAGHLYQTIYGDSVARLIERAGATVHRTNFGADVGLSAARALWGILNYIGGEYPEKLNEIPDTERTKFIASSYVEGAKADTSKNDAASAEILAVNKRIYAMHAEGDKSSSFAQIYFTCRDWCREYFESLYRELEIDEFEKYYPESSTEERGRREVDAHKGTVFAESQGAIVYEGEKDGLHTRVFMTKEGLPTYETKDLGLIFTEKDDFSFVSRILVTGKEQSEYMKVVWRAADKISPGIEASMTHLTNGLIRFGDGSKMSSRTGNVTTAMDVIKGVKDAVGISDDVRRDSLISLGALKYEFLKHRLGGDIAFDPEQSVSLQGDSGPYLQYALVRAKAIIDKSSSAAGASGELDNTERKLVRKLAEYSLVVEKATTEYMPHYIAGYLYELAQEFNRFYENARVIGDEREPIRIRIVREYATTLEHGLNFLGIRAPEKM